jgi:chromosome segregation ATPase
LFPNIEEAFILSKRGLRDLTLDSLEIFESKINRAVEAINRLKQEKGQLVQTISQLEAKASELEKEKRNFNQKYDQLLVEKQKTEEAYKEKEEQAKQRIKAILDKLSILSDG